MPRSPRPTHSPAFKAKVALEALKSEQPVIEAARPGSLHGLLPAPADELHRAFDHGRAGRDTQEVALPRDQEDTQRAAQARASDRTPEKWRP